MSEGGSPCSGRTLLPFIRKTKVPLAGGQENTFQVIWIWRGDFMREDSGKLAAYTVMHLSQGLGLE